MYPAESIAKAMSCEVVTGAGRLSTADAYCLKIVFILLNFERRGTSDRPRSGDLVEARDDSMRIADVVVVAEGVPDHQLTNRRKSLCKQPPTRRQRAAGVPTWEREHRASHSAGGH